MGDCISVLIGGDDILFEAGGSIIPKLVVVVVMVMVFGCTSPCWLVQWPAIIATGSISQFVIVLFQNKCCLHGVQSFLNVSSFFILWWMSL